MVEVRVVPDVWRLVAEQVEGDEADRVVRMRDAWSAYCGYLPKPLTAPTDEPYENVVLNLGRLFVDKGVSFLFGGGVDLKVEGGRRGAQSWLDRVLAANRQPTLLHRLGITGGVCGHTFVRLTAADGGGGLPRIVVVDPMTVRVQWATDDVERIVEYRIEWSAIEPEGGHAAAYRQIMRPSVGDRPGWDILDQKSDRDNAAWRTVRCDRWPYAWAPMLGCQNLPVPNAHWGAADIDDDVLGVLRAINFVLSNAVRILRIHAHPKLWGSGFAKGAVELGPDDITVLPSADAKLGLLEMRGDLRSSMELYRRLKEAVHEMARVPEASASSIEAAGRLSGAATRALYEPLIEKTETKRALYGDMLAEMGRRLLEMGGYGRGARVRVVWPSPTPRDPLEEARTALIHRQIGADVDTVLRSLGIGQKEGDGCRDGSM